MSFLVTSKKISPLSNAYTMFRVFLSFLAEPLSFPVFLDPSMPDSVKTLFSSNFPVVFVGESGIVNSFARLSESEFAEIRADAVEALALEIRRSLFVERVPFCLKWDLLVSFTDFPTSEVESSGDLMSYLGREEYFLRQFVDVLKRGLSTRCVAISHRTDLRQIGIRLNAEASFRKLDAGPPAHEKGNDLCLWFCVFVSEFFLFSGLCRISSFLGPKS